jgi:hypothetical protein
MKSLKQLVMILLVASGCLASVLAQTDRGTVRGTISDPNGAAVVGATVSANNIETNDKRDVTTSSEGIFVFPELKAGLYQISVSATGFNPTNVDNVKVDVQGVQSLEIKLEVGAVGGNVVTVNADAVSINSDTPVRQTTVTERQVRELPLAVNSESGGRTPLAFIFLDSNVGATDQGGNQTNSSKFKVSGGQGSGTEILIDGASTRRTQNGTFFTEVAPGPNAYREFTVSTNSYSAEFGNSSGGIVNFTVKSGSNEFHGEAYEYVRNEVLNANSVYNKGRVLLPGQKPIPRNRDNQNNFGFNIGGPIYVPGFGEGTPILRSLKDKAFFFANYEGYRFIRGVNALETVPTLRMRNGDFGELLTDPYIRNFRDNQGNLAFPNGIQIYDPRLPSNTRTAIAGNRLDLVNNIILVPGNDCNGCLIPRPLIDPAGLAILQRYPLPTRAGVHENFESLVTVPNVSNSITGKVDINLTSKQTMNVSYSRKDNERIAGGLPVLPLPFAQSFGPFDQTFRSNIARIQHDFTITPSLINHFNVGYTFYDVRNATTTYGFDTSSLGIPRNATSNASFPLIDFVGEGNDRRNPRFTTDIGSTDFADRLRDGSLEFGDSVTFITGRQTFKFGAAIRLAQFNVQQLIHPGGRFGFHEDQTRSDADNSSGSPLASLITGATEWSFVGNDTVDPAFRQMSQSYFVQDDIKLSQKLTLNLGLRYDLPGQRIEGRDLYRGFDPNAINPQIGRRGALAGAAGQGGVQAEFRSLAPADKTNIGPRVGVAYALNNKTVIRGGIGLYYAPILYGTGGNGSIKAGTIGYNNDDINPRPNGRNTPGNQFLSTFRSLNSYPGIDVSGTSQFIGALAQAIPYFDKDFKTGRTLQYTIDLQRELPFRLVGSIGYIGHRADRLRSNFGRLNALPLDALKLGFPILNKNLNDVTTPERAYATSIGITIPTSSNAVYTGFNGSVAQALKPFPQYGRIENFLESQGESDYNAMQLKLDRRFAQGVQFGLAYTWSKLITNASEDILGGSAIDSVIQNPFDRASLKTISPTNSPHVFVANFLAELPIGKGKRFLNHGGITNVLLGGFQVSGIFRYQAGLPLVFSQSSRSAEQGGDDFLDLAGYYGSLRPNLTGQPLELSQRTPFDVGQLRVLNPAAFSAPRSFTTNVPAVLVNGVINPAYVAYYSNPQLFFGTAPLVNENVRSDGFFSENLNILKKTRITETVALEVGAEFFNLFNRVRYLQPNTDLGRVRVNNGTFDNGAFGVIGVVDEPRVIQLRARIIF